MPKIQEYLPEVEASGPQGGVSPNLEQVSQWGRGIENFGKSITETGDLIHRRQAQSEVSDAYANTTQARVDFTEDLNDKIASGKLDTDQFKSDFQDWVNKQSDNYSTPEGKNYFNKQINRLGGSLLTHAIKGQAVIASNNAVADFTKARDNDTNSLENDPTQFADVYHANLEHLTTLSEQGLVPAGAKLNQLTQETGKELSMAAIRGHAKSDPDEARQMLEQGAFDQFLNSDDKKRAYAEVKQYKTANDIEDERIDQAAKRADAAKDRQFINENAVKIFSGGFSAKDAMKAVKDGKLSGSGLEKILSSIKTGNEDQVRVDPAKFNSIAGRMLLPKNDPKAITTPEQVLDLVNKKEVPADSYKALISRFDDSPAGQARIESMRSLDTVAKRELDKSTSYLQDPNGPYRLSQFNNWLHGEEERRRQAKEPLDPLYDPNSNEYAGKQLTRFKGSMNDILKAQADQRAGRFEPPALVKTAIGTTASPTPAPNPENKRKANESAADYLKRIKGK